MTRFIRGILLALGLAGAIPAQPAFHLFIIDEIYSNADGSVQFIELRALSGGQQFVQGQRISATSGGTPGETRSFTFPNNLPGDTSGRTFLVATQGFAALGVVSPDFVVPNGFLFQNGGSVNFADVDLWNHGALPTDNRSLDRNSGNPQTPTPRNFAGQTGTVPSSPGPSALIFQGLWYRGEVESGWGVNLAHQGNIIFATWFTYDTDGSQMWLVGSDVRKGTGNTFTGALYRTTGPAFNSQPFTPIGASNITQVGTITFTFTDANNGTMSYTVNGVTQSKPIVRQVFGPLPTCEANGAQGSTLNFQNLWYAAPADSEAGWGVNVTHQGDILFVTWFTYDANGRGMWVVGPRMERTTGNTFTGLLYRTTGPAFSANPWNPQNVNVTQVGNATMTFTSASAGTFNYTVNGITQTKNIVPQVFTTPPTVCR
jgi:hypothetical protein